MSVEAVTGELVAVGLGLCSGKAWQYLAVLDQWLVSCGVLASLLEYHLLVVWLVCLSDSGW